MGKKKAWSRAPWSAQMGPDLGSVRVFSMTSLTASEDTQGRGEEVSATKRQHGVQRQSLFCTMHGLPHTIACDTELLLSYIYHIYLQ